MKKRLSKNDSGYSLVELLIVMAIIAVLAATAMISYTMIHSAKAKDAAIKVGSEVNELKTRCMNMTPGDGTHSAYALRLYTEGNTPHVELVQFNDTSGIYDSVPNEDKNLSSSVRVEFTGDYGVHNNGSTWSKSDYIPGAKTNVGENDSPVYICFDKRGNCYSGYGEYNFKKSNGTTVAHVNIGKNGSVSVR